MASTERLLLEFFSAVQELRAAVCDGGVSAQDFRRLTTNLELWHPSRVSIDDVGLVNENLLELAQDIIGKLRKASDRRAYDLDPLQFSPAERLAFQGKAVEIESCVQGTLNSSFGISAPVRVGYSLERILARPASEIAAMSEKNIARELGCVSLPEPLQAERQRLRMAAGLSGRRAGARGVGGEDFTDPESLTVLDLSTEDVIASNKMLLNLSTLESLCEVTDLGLASDTPGYGVSFASDPEELRRMLGLKGAEIVLAVDASNRVWMMFIGFSDLSELMSLPPGEFQVTRDAIETARISFDRDGFPIMRPVNGEAADAALESGNPPDYCGFGYAGPVAMDPRMTMPISEGGGGYSKEVGHALYRRMHAVLIDELEKKGVTTVVAIVRCEPAPNIAMGSHSSLGWTMLDEIVSAPKTLENMDGQTVEVRSFVLTLNSASGKQEELAACPDDFRVVIVDRTNPLCPDYLRGVVSEEEP